MPLVILEATMGGRRIRGGVALPSKTIFESDFAILLPNNVDFQTFKCYHIF